MSKFLIRNGETVPTIPDLPKPTLKRKHPLSPELEQAIITLELAEAADDPHWLELALVILEDMRLIKSIDNERLKEKIRKEMMK